MTAILAPIAAASFFLEVGKEREKKDTAESGKKLQTGMVSDK